MLNERNLIIVVIQMVYLMMQLIKQYRMHENKRAFNINSFDDCHSFDIKQNKTTNRNYKQNSTHESSSIAEL